MSFMKTNTPIPLGGIVLMNKVEKRFDVLKELFSGIGGMRYHVSLKPATHILTVRRADMKPCRHVSENNKPPMKSIPQQPSQRRWKFQATINLSVPPCAPGADCGAGVCMGGSECYIRS